MNKTISQTIYETLKNDIIVGSLKSGIKLKLNILKDKYGVSVSILRETLSRLASEGFIEAKEQKGFYVSPISKEDFQEILDLRILIECHAIKVAIENRTDDWESELVASYHKLRLMEKRIENEEFDKINEWKTCDRKFHQTIIASTNSKHLIELHSLIYDKYLRYQMKVLTFRGDEVLDHQKLFDAIILGDIELSQEILKNHITEGFRKTNLDELGK